NDDGALTADATELLTGDPDFEYALLAPWHPTPAGDLRLLVGGADGVGLATIDLDAGALPTTRLFEAPAEALAVADVDGDGLLDLVLGTAEELFVHLADERVGG
ncbi:MAG: FG-GAP repeat protein, partial [Myxococcales bacterium]|nr:FG-GAP repeat protein [Myxococcales bacterium]